VSEAPTLDRGDLGFLLAKSSQRWNELLYARFVAAGYGEVRPSYGSVLIPLYEEDSLRMIDLAARARLSKQTMTTMVRLAERDGLVDRRQDESDRRATRVHLTDKGRRFKPVAERILAELDEVARAVLGARGLSAAERALAALAGLEPGSPD
jgi:MarR family transcriptional regulator, transcriptional regulator for hemolysin